jgi:hypothetical protein
VFSIGRADKLLSMQRIFIESCEEKDTVPLGVFVKLSLLRGVCGGVCVCVCVWVGGGGGGCGWGGGGGGGGGGVAAAAVVVVVVYLTTPSVSDTSLEPCNWLSGDWRTGRTLEASDCGVMNSLS